MLPTNLKMVTVGLLLVSAFEDGLLLTYPAAAEQPRARKAAPAVPGELLVSDIRPEGKADTPGALKVQWTSDLIWRKLGLRLQPISPEKVTRVHPQLHGGLLVCEVRPASSSVRAGIKAGDILVGLHQWEMLSLANVDYVLKHRDLAQFSPLRYWVLRNQQVKRGQFPQLD